MSYFLLVEKKRTTSGVVQLKHNEQYNRGIFGNSYRKEKLIIYA